MGSTGPEAEKGKSRFVRGTAGGKESTGSEGTQMLDEILSKLTDLRLTSYRRDLDKQKQEMTTLKMSHQPSYQGNWNLSPEPHPAGAAWPGDAFLSRSPLRFRVRQSDRAMVPSGTEEDTECVADCNLEKIPVETVKREATGPANLELLRSTEIHRRHLESWAGRSASSPTYGTE